MGPLGGSPLKQVMFSAFRRGPSSPSLIASTGNGGPSTLWGPKVKGAKANWRIAGSQELGVPFCFSPPNRWHMDRNPLAKLGGVHRTCCPFETCCFFNTKRRWKPPENKLQCSGVFHAWSMLRPSTFTLTSSSSSCSFWSSLATAGETRESSRRRFSGEKSRAHPPPPRPVGLAPAFQGLFCDLFVGSPGRTSRLGLGFGHARVQHSEFGAVCSIDLFWPAT